MTRSSGEAFGKLSAWRWALLLPVLWLILASVPRLPEPFGPGLDTGWPLGLNMAHQQHLVRGKDIVWTYGPLGYLNFPDTTGNALYTVLSYRLALYVIWALSLVRLCFLVQPGAKAVAIALTFGLIAALDPGAANDPMELAVVGVALTAMADRTRWRTVALALLACLAALAALMKLTLGLEAFAILAGQAFWPNRPRRQLVAAAAVYLLCVPGFYYLASGTLRSLPAYFRNSWEISAGYSEAMGMPGSLNQLLAAVASLVFLFAVLPLAERPIRTVIPAWLVSIFPAFLLFKGAMVRQDLGHAASFELRLAALALVFIVLAHRPVYFYAVAAFQCGLLLLGLYSVSGSIPRFRQALEDRLTLREAARSGHAILQWPETWRQLQAVTSTALSILRAGPGLIPAIGSGSVEAMPWDVASVKVNGWTWNPRPIFQAYSAYTPRLDGLNAAHLESDRAADFIVQDWLAIDGRHPFLETPLSWQAQLNRYEGSRIYQDQVLFRRRPNPRFERREDMGSVIAQWGQEVSVPQDPNPVLVAARIELSLYGSIRTLLLRSGPIWVEFTHRSGAKTRYRALRRTFTGGVLINQLPENTGDLLLLARGCTPSDPVTSFHLIAETPAELKADIGLEWSRLISRPAEQASGCVDVESAPATFPPWGGSGTLHVTAGAGIPWALQAGDAWVRFLAPPNGTGKGEVSYTVLPNAGSDRRTAEIRVDGAGASLSQLAKPGGMDANPIQLGFFRGLEWPWAVPPAPLKPGVEVVIDVLDRFGLRSDIPVSGDWTGSGAIRVGVFREGRWFLDLNGNRQWDGVEGGDGLYAFGQAGDTPVVGDWNGDGATKLGVFRQGTWILDVNGNHTFDSPDAIHHFGLAADKPVVGKWTPGSSKDRIGIYREGVWVLDSNGDGIYDSTDLQFSFGYPDDTPLVSKTRSHIGVTHGSELILDRNNNHQYDPADLVIPVSREIGRFFVGEW